jgi:hypothetical protein
MISSCWAKWHSPCATCSSACAKCSRTISTMSMPDTSDTLPLRSPLLHPQRHRSLRHR